MSSILAFLNIQMVLFFFLEDRIWSLPGVRDVTQELRIAATNLDARH
jgi:hypothetical protein